MNWKFWENLEADDSRSGLIARVAGGAIGAYLLIALGFAWWWDHEPDVFGVRDVATVHAQASSRDLVTGYVTTATLIRLVEVLLVKRGGYIPAWHRQYQAEQGQVRRQDRRHRGDGDGHRSRYIAGREAAQRLREARGATDRRGL